MKIQFYPDEHPPAHFHAIIAEHIAQIDINTLQVLKGSLPRSKLREVTDWADNRRPQLIAASEAMRAGRKPGMVG